MMVNALHIDLDCEGNTKGKERENNPIMMHEREKQDEERGEGSRFKQPGGTASCRLDGKKIPPSKLYTYIRTYESSRVTTLSTTLPLSSSCTPATHENIVVADCTLLATTAADKISTRGAS
jgi:hypothetical protein